MSSQKKKRTNLTSQNVKESKSTPLQKEKKATSTSTQGNKSTMSWGYIIKHSPRLQNAFLIAFLIIVIASALFFKGISSSHKAPKAAAEANTDTGTNNTVVVRNVNFPGHSDAIDGLVTNYMTGWFDALAQLKFNSMASLFYTESPEGQLASSIDDAALRYMVSTREKQSNDLKLSHYAVGLTYTSITANDDQTVDVVVLEDHDVNFAFLGDTHSYSSGIEHDFKLIPSGDSYKIVTHHQEESGYIFIEDEVAASANPSQPDLNGIVDKLLAEAQTDIDALNQSKATAQTSADADSSYNRDAAINYSKDWTNQTQVVRNPIWMAYDGYAGNCNNFTSQCLNAGGIPFDMTGEEQWYWQDDEDRTASWTGVDAFNYYAANNKEGGLKSDTTRNPFSGQPGDVLQFGHQGELYHSVLVTDVVHNDEGAVVDYLTNSNTTDRINYPTCAYNYTTFTLIHVLGVNQ